ncbi:MULTISPECIES: L,D-transpeptidase family protein [unclassified Rhizobium]|uniref:L,D-transpeptidase family protein n=1 Tax=unclassified Rhizobium TaxID=2613769 RepID=UPI0009E76EDC|nr:MULTISPECIES: L,D-transpeptidase [unclassified Rhizobium]
MAASLGPASTPAAAQSRIVLSPDQVLVTPQGDVLDYVPENGEVRVMRDARGRTVLVDNWGNIVATVMGSRGANAGRRRAAPDSYGAEPYGDEAFGGRPRRERVYGNGTFGDEADRDRPYVRGRDGANGVPDYRNFVPPGVERGDLPAADETLPDENDMAALPPEQPPASQGTTLPRAATITRKSSAEITALQVFLDREGFSPGVIDGKNGSNVTKAIEAWQQATGETLDPNNTEDILERLRLSGGLAITTYTITAADAAGPYVAEIPEDYAHKALLPHMSFTSTTEMLGERFHMDEAYLRELNPGVDFTIPGTIIKVINPGEPKTGKVTRIVADKPRKQVFAYDESGALIAAYPATIGSSDTPSPSGTVQVDRIALNPGYTYNPKINFKQGENDKVLTLQPGPNGPVGTVWIALSKPTYGIHGTPEPSKIGKTQSHGCVRLTNWDATELAKMVSVGTTVEFLD